ncbi:phosphoribosylanthranilate isomerase [Erythrobacteraceae bacterium E2-1 Yellow Sea]|nr:phosphoribosylanthranilate isomerase [Erythrobacteraceae bacterium E2-1 Yellow Sea]
MPIQIKICGLSTPETLKAAMDAGASHVGLNFYPPSPRYVSPERAVELAALAGKRAGKVGVFVNADDEFLGASIAAGALDAIQLHGAETPQRAREVQSKFGLPVWKALAVSTAEDVAKARDYADAVDLILFDARTPKGALPGGMGLSFDWSLLNDNHGATHWGLAGGLTPTNVGDAIRATGATLVDTSSGVEIAPGVKDVDLIRAFCKAALNN